MCAAHSAHSTSKPLKLSYCSYSKLGLGEAPHVLGRTYQEGAKLGALSLCTSVAFSASTSVPSYPAILLRRDAAIGCCVATIWLLHGIHSQSSQKPYPYARVRSTTSGYPEAQSPTRNAGQLKIHYKGARCLQSEQKASGTTGWHIGHRHLLLLRCPPALTIERTGPSQT